MRPHTVAEAAAVVDCVEDWQDVFLPGARPPARVRGRRVLPAGRAALPGAGGLRGLRDARGRRRHGPHPRAGAVRAEGRRHRQAGRVLLVGRLVELRRRRLRALPRRPRHRRPAAAGAPVAAGAGRHPHRHLRRPGAGAAARPARPRRRAGRAGRQPVLRRHHRASPACWWGRTSPAPSPPSPSGHRYLLPDVCLSNGRFLDGTGPEDLPRPVEVIATDGHALREALDVADRTLEGAR